MATTTQNVHLLHVAVEDGDTVAEAVCKGIRKDTTLRGLELIPHEHTVCMVVEDAGVPPAYRLMVELRPWLSSERSGLRMVRARGGPPCHDNPNVVRMEPRLRILDGGKKEPPPVPWDAEEARATSAAKKSITPEPTPPPPRMSVLEGGARPVRQLLLSPTTLRKRLRYAAVRFSTALRTLCGSAPLHSDVCRCACHLETALLVTRRLYAYKRQESGDLVLRLECEAFPWCDECATFETLNISVNTKIFSGWKRVDDGDTTTFELCLTPSHHGERLRLLQALEQPVVNDVAEITVDIGVDGHTVNTRFDDFRCAVRQALPLALQGAAMRRQGGE